ncbi:hypothetical protein D3C81_1595140 [compost metagenome]
MKEDRTLEFRRNRNPCDVLSLYAAQKEGFAKVAHPQLSDTPRHMAGCRDGFYILDQPLFLPTGHTSHIVDSIRDFPLRVNDR